MQPHTNATSKRTDDDKSEESEEEEMPTSSESEGEVNMANPFRPRPLDTMEFRGFSTDSDYDSTNHMVSGPEMLTSIPVSKGSLSEKGILNKFKAPDRSKSSPAGNKASNDPLMKCSQEVKEHYKKFSNVLRIKLPPTTEEKMFSVDDLHVPVMLTRREISPDLPVTKEVNAQELFQRSSNIKNKILLCGPTGSGKTTEIKKWIHSWCHNKEDNPFQDMTVVFYIDAAEMELGSSLGEAIKHQCLPAYSALSAERVEAMCHERESEILVIVDNYQRLKTDKEANVNSLMKMVQLEDFPSMFLLVATSSGGVGAFKKIYAQYDHVRVGGISEESVDRYLTQLFKNREDTAFKSNLLEYIEGAELVPVMASSPELLAILCQILKWHELPTEIEGLKTTSVVIDRLMECLTKRSDYVRGRERELSVECEPCENEREGDEGELLSPTLSLKTDDNCTQDPFQQENIESHLAAVAFNSYLKGECLENLQLRENDFDIIGEDLKSKVMDESMRLKLLYKLGEDEINPSSYQAAEGRVYKFLSPVFQQKLAAKHISKLLNGDDEDRMLFNTTLQKIGDIGEALSLRSLLLLACGESRKAAFAIITHVVKLAEDYAKNVHPDPRKEDGVLREAHGHYQYLVEFILELNYEAQSDGKLNEILRPIATKMRILSPSVIVTRALSYFLMHTSPADGPPIYPVNIEVYDIDKEIKEKLPSLGHVRYSYREKNIMKVEREDSASPSEQNIRRLSIRVEQTTQMQTTHNEVPSVVSTAVRAPNVDIPSAGENEMPWNDSLPHSIQESAELEEGNLLERNSSRNYREIPEISREEMKVHCDIPMAEGRFGEVFKVTYRGKEYAMKRLKNMDEDSCLSAQREIKMNARMSHPNIVVLHAYAQYEIGNTGTYRFELLMDYIDGYNLEQAIFQKKVKYLENPKGQIELAWKVSDAIAHIHTKSCTHADIKPQNILIKVPENEPYLCDFGLGHAMTHSALTSGRRYSVQRWSPPECSAQGYHASFAADVWSLACTMLEIFTRRKVWDDYYDHDWKLINRLKEDIVVPETLSDVADPAIRDILGRCFTKEPSHRPEAKELVDTLKQALDSIQFTSALA